MKLINYLSKEGNLKREGNKIYGNYRGFNIGIVENGFIRKFIYLKVNFKTKDKRVRDRLYSYLIKNCGKTVKFERVEEYYCELSFNGLKNSKFYNDVTIFINNIINFLIEQNCKFGCDNCGNASEELSNYFVKEEWNNFNSNGKIYTLCSECANEYISRIESNKAFFKGEKKPLNTIISSMLFVVVINTVCILLWILLNYFQTFISNYIMNNNLELKSTFIEIISMIVSLVPVGILFLNALGYIKKYKEIDIIGMIFTSILLIISLFKVEKIINCLDICYYIKDLNLIYVYKNYENYLLDSDNIINYIIELNQAELLTGFSIIVTISGIVVGILINECLYFSKKTKLKLQRLDTKK